MDAKAVRVYGKVYRVVAVSKNTGAFGHHGVIVMAEDGDAHELKVIMHNVKSLGIVKGKDLTVPTHFPADGPPDAVGEPNFASFAEVPRRLPRPPQKVIDEVWPVKTPKPTKKHERKNAYREKVRTEIGKLCNDTSVVPAHPDADQHLSTYVGGLDAAESGGIGFGAEHLTARNAIMQTYHDRDALRDRLAELVNICTHPSAKKADIRQIAEEARETIVATRHT